MELKKRGENYVKSISPILGKGKFRNRFYLPQVCRRKLRLVVSTLYQAFKIMGKSTFSRQSSQTPIYYIQKQALTAQNNLEINVIRKKTFNEKRKKKMRENEKLKKNREINQCD